MGKIQARRTAAQNDRVPLHGCLVFCRPWVGLDCLGVRIMTPDNTPTPQAGETKVWRYDIQYGPDGEANYAWVYFDKEMVCICRITHAKAIIESATAILTLQSQLEIAKAGLSMMTERSDRFRERAEKVEKERDEWSRKHSDAVWSLNQILEAAESEVVKLRAALEPFANASRIELEGAVRKVYVSVADLRRARAALDKGGE